MDYLDAAINELEPENKYSKADLSNVVFEIFQDGYSEKSHMNYWITIGITTVCTSAGDTVVQCTSTRWEKVWDRSSSTSG